MPERKRVRVKADKFTVEKRFVFFWTQDFSLELAWFDNNYLNPYLYLLPILLQQLCSFHVLWLVDGGQGKSQFSTALFSHRLAFQECPPAIVEHFSRSRRIEVIFFDVLMKPHKSLGNRTIGYSTVSA